MTGEYMFRLGQHNLMNDNIDKAIKFLRLSSEKGHEEASWIVSLMDQTPFVESEDGGGSNETWIWCHSVFEKEDSDRALCYRLWFMDLSNEIDLKLVKYAADTGNAVGQYHYYTILSNRWELTRENFIYLEKAASQNLLMAIRDRAKCAGINCPTDRIGDPHMKFYLHGAELGDLTCIEMMSHAYSKICDISVENRINYVKWRCRHSIYGGNSFQSAGELKAIRVSIADSSEKNTDYIYNYFTVGREVDGYDEYFIRFREAEHEELQKAVEFYRRILNIVRKSALFTLWALKPVLSKDVATIIAKLIYDSRLDPVIWVGAN